MIIPFLYIWIIILLSALHYFRSHIYRENMENQSCLRTACLAKLNVARVRNTIGDYGSSILAMVCDLRGSDSTIAISKFECLISRFAAPISTPTELPRPKHFDIHRHRYRRDVSTYLLCFLRWKRKKSHVRVGLAEVDVFWWVGAWSKWNISFFFR